MKNVGTQLRALRQFLCHADLRALPDRFRLLAALIFSLTLCACASPTDQPETKLSFQVPLTWSESPTVADSNDVVEWWTRFHDPVLDTLVTESLKNNLSIRTAQSTLRQAWALRDIAAAALLPSLDGSATAQHNRVNAAGSSNLFQVGVNANWDIDIFGGARSGRDAAEYAALASNASVGDTQVAICAEVGLTYISLRVAQARFEIARKNLANQVETLQITQWRQQAGFLTDLEVEQARSSVEQTRALLPALQIAIGQNQHVLALLTGQPPRTLELQLNDPQPVPQADGDLALTIPAETLRQRADVRAAEYNVLASEERVSQAQAARLPGFSLGGSIGMSALTAGMLTNGSSAVGSLIAGVTMPIFDGGARRAQVDLQQGAAQQAQLAYATAVLTALSDVENALIALRNDQQRLKSMRIAGESAANASHLANERYSSGLVDFQVVLQTQLTQLVTQDAVASANADVSSDQIRLYKALGGGWRPDSLQGAAADTPTGIRSNQVTTP